MLGNPPGGLSEDITPVLVNGADSPLGLELFAVAVDSTIGQRADRSRRLVRLGLAWQHGRARHRHRRRPRRSRALHVCVTHKNSTVTHRRQADQGGAWTDWTTWARRTPARSLTPR